MTLKSIRTFRFLIILTFAISACKPSSLFTELNNSGVNFENKLTETESENILAYEYFYNGGGVAAADFNNDGLIDLYFTGNQVENKLYQNKGKLAFEDITQKAGVTGRNGGWKTGVCAVDINADGWLDIYVSYSGLRPDSLRKNQFFINNGINPRTKTVTFTDKSAEMGLDDSGYSTQATFFDYDLDGDLDCFLINHNKSGYERKEAHVMRATYDYNAGDKLFRNENLKFTDVSVEAGIKGNPLGFGLGVSIADINQDGFPDIYVANDFVEDDYLYINQKNGTFKDELRSYIQQTSYSSMGVDIGDINNDLMPDIITTDMLPEDNDRQKLLVWPDNWNVYQAQLANGFWHQNMRNMFQLNEGNGKFSEIGQVSGISNTDWSWAVLMSDFDLDGYKDIFVSNGLAKDLTNTDFIKYFDEAQSAHLPLLEHLKQMTSSQTKNYIYRNAQNLRFENKQKEWGFDNSTISNGTIYADLDNDGDLEIITNNLNETSKIYKNNLQENTPTNFIKIKLKGLNKNINGLGAIITLKDSKGKQVHEVSLTHGFQSSYVGDILFGLTDKSCEIHIKWPTGKTQILKANANKTLVLDEKNASETPNVNLNETPIYAISDFGINYKQEIAAINNFDNQILLPCQYSYFGPKMISGDLNNDGLDEVIVCGTASKSAQIFLNKNGEFIASPNNFDLKNNQNIALADFNKDGFLDIYFANGTYESAIYAMQNDEIWLNDGKGNFKQKVTLTDQINNKAVSILDIDNDGDLDIFLGGNIKPNKYPYCDESLLLVNNGNLNFTKVSFGALGIVNESVTIQKDILAVGEWMEPTYLKNSKGKYSIATNKIPSNLEGWWNTIQKGDLDGDGDEDLIVGNIGENTQFKASTTEPATLIYDDFDQNLNPDFFISYYIQGKAYPAYSRDEVVEQIPMLRKKFTTYKSYSEATVSDFFDEKAYQKALKKNINEVKTLILENQIGNFVVHNLPIQAQFSPVYAILLDDYNKDGKVDILLGGNCSKFRLRIGKVSANNGQLYKNKGAFNFEYIAQKNSGFNVSGDVRSIVKVNQNLIFGINNDKTLSFKKQSAGSHQ